MRTLLAGRCAVMGMKPPLVAATRLGQSSVRGAGIVAAVAFWMLLVGPMPAVGRGLPDPDDQWAAAANAESDADQPARHVLLLYTEPRLQPSLVVLDHALRATL